MKKQSRFLDEGTKAQSALKGTSVAIKNIQITISRTE
jgi:hypothetical protein